MRELRRTIDRLEREIADLEAQADEQAPAAEQGQGDNGHVA